MRCVSRRAVSIGRQPVSARFVLAFIALATLAVLPGTAGAQSGTISTVAGTGIQGYNGDGIPASAAQLSEPYAVAFDSAGNLYIADFSGNRIRRIDAATGLITTVAGTGAFGDTPDGVQATAAALGYVTAIAVDADDNLYFSEYLYHRIRRVDASSGVLSTIAGTGSEGYSGDNGPGTAAKLYYPWGLTVNASGDVVIADFQNNRVRVVTAATGIISTIAGTGTAGSSGDNGPATAADLYGPLGVSYDAAGNLYITEQNSHRVRRVDGATGVITTVAGTGVGGFSGDGGPGTAAQVFAPYGVTAARAGSLLFADYGNQRVRRIDLATGIIDTIAGTAVPGYNGDGIPAIAAQLHDPLGIAVDANGDLYIADRSNARIRKVAFLPVPVITWANPAGIVYGTALSATQLNATANVAGTFVYTPAAGALLNAGAGQTLSTTFTPDDTATYAPATATVTIDVAKATPAFNWAVPAAVPSGTVLGSSQLNASSNVAGTFVYDPPAGTVVTATVQLYAYFTPDDSANYLSTMGDVQLTVLSGPVNGPPYTLTVTVPTGGKIQGAGIMCGLGYTACSVTMPASMTLGLTAVAATGYTFTNWTGDCTGTTTSQWVSLAGPRACSAVFTQVVETHTLTIAPVPTGGTVTGAGVSCGSGGSTCAVTFGSVTTASLTATADSGYVFAGWGGACSGTSAATSVSVSGTTTCSATFTASGGGASGPPYTLTVTTPTGGKIQGAGINCGSGGTACSVTMPAAMTLGLTATASEGYTFTAWTGDCTGTTSTQWLSLKGPRSCGATFTAAGGGGGGTPAGSGIITPIAGTGASGFGGDGGAATAAVLYNPTDVATDAAGNVYIGDGENHRVRKIAAGTGVITTAAGTGAAGFSGDGGPATAAELHYPYGVAVDQSGNLFIAEYYSHRVRRVDAGTGLITTVAGTGTTTYNGDGIPATAAALYYPFGLAVDGAGNIYIGENEGRRVRMVSAATGLIATIAGTGVDGYGGDGGPATAAQISSPYGIAVDAAGNVYLADLYNNRVRRVDAGTGTITTVAGTGVGSYGGDGGPATTAQLDYPLGVALDAAGNLLISEYNNHRVRMVAASTGVITTIAGTGVNGYSGDGGPATAAQISYPYGIDVDGEGNLYIADLSNQRIRMVGPGTVAPVDGPPYTLTITPPTGGKIQGAGINCGAGGTACSVTMPAQMTLGLAATPSAGYTFGGWTGNCSGASASLWLDLKGARTCSATFTAVR